MTTVFAHQGHNACGRWRLAISDVIMTSSGSVIFTIFTVGVMLTILLQNRLMWN